MTDWYLENKTRLKGQPKRVVGEYVESEGILVPRRFSSFDKAVVSGLPVIARSEHEQDYDGCSGLVDSVCLDKEYEEEKITSESMLEAKVFSDREYGEKLYKQFSRFTGRDANQVKSEFSFSYWEKIEGLNRTVVADSAIKDRYHVMTYGEKMHNYTLIDVENETLSFGSSLTPELQKGLRELINFYEQIAHLGKFDSKHRPTIEVQTDTKGRNHFLQYHHTRDFSSANFVLDREKESGESEAMFVRGATNKEGMDCRVVVYYAGGADFSFQDQGEEGSWDLHWNKVFPELQARQRKLQMLNTHAGKEDLDFEMLSLAVGHTYRSKMFKPAVSIISPIKNYLSQEDIKSLCNFARTGKNACIDLHVVSDGRRAFVKRID